ncbi:hypothetical protein [Larkinella soli]|uniref:hypothetical protein n=1 Tax=Larkinella soli TaxID=1770527 RepID=UPI000FFBEE9C|nr:hypothetical protein [Larkinella soli]
MVPQLKKVLFRLLLPVFLPAALTLSCGGPETGTPIRPAQSPIDTLPPVFEDHPDDQWKLKGFYDYMARREPPIYFTREEKRMMEDYPYTLPVRVLQEVQRTGTKPDIRNLYLELKYPI